MNQLGYNVIDVTGDIKALIYGRQYIQSIICLIFIKVIMKQTLNKIQSFINLTFTQFHHPHVIGLGYFTLVLSVVSINKTTIIILVLFLVFDNHWLKCYFCLQREQEQPIVPYVHWIVKKILTQNEGYLYCNVCVL